MSNIPWVEKYRPTDFTDIVLDETNKQIFNNIIHSGNFPNLILYGPPGTGKTTTIVNLIKSYQNKHERITNELIIHLNASDERGVDIIRNQINNFVSSKTMFHKGLKFVILDEVDYMTKPAQQALKYMVQTNSKNIRYCLICNYISKIEENLQVFFLKFRFNSIPKEDILCFLKNIVDKEQINISDESLVKIINMYNSDIRCMINFIQSNQYNNINILEKKELEKLFDDIQNGKKIVNIIKKINEMCVLYNIDARTMLKNIYKYIIYDKNIVDNELLNVIEQSIHYEIDIAYSVNRVCLILSK